MEKKIETLDREMGMKQNNEEQTKRILGKFETQMDKIEEATSDIKSMQNKVNAFEELMGVQRSELFRAMSEFETNVLKKHDNFNRAFKVLSNELNLPNPLMGTSF